MKRKEFLLHIIGEISNYLLSRKPGRMVISVHQETDGLHLSAFDDSKYSDEELRQIEASLNSRKRPELAAYYGEMTGHDLLGTSRLNILGWQVKHADVSRTSSGIKIDIWVGGAGFESDKFSIPDGKG